MTLAARSRAALRDGPLASRPFRLLTAGQVSSTIGDYCYAVALPWLVLSAHGGTVLLGAVLACYGIPRTVLIPAGGVLADRLGPRAVMLGADCVRCGLAAAMTALAAGHLVTLAALGPVAAVLGAGEGVFIPASMAIMPTLLPAARLPAGNAVNMAALQAGSLLGPVLGGALVATAGPAPAFGVDAASFAVSAAALAAMARPRPAASPAPGAAGATDTATDTDTAADTGADTGAADATATPEAATLPAGSAQDAPGGVLALLRRSRVLQLLVAVCVLANFAFAGTFAVALPALAHARFGAAGYGALIACLAAGSLAGTLAAGRSGRLRRPAVTASMAFLMTAAAVAAVPWAGGLAGAAACIVAYGAGNGFGNTTYITLLQRWAPPRLLGRVMSLVMLASLGTFPVSVALTGAAVRSFGPVPFFPVAAAALAVAVGGSLAWPQLRSFGQGGSTWRASRPLVP